MGTALDLFDKGGCLLFSCCCLLLGGYHGFGSVAGVDTSPPGGQPSRVSQTRLSFCLFWLFSVSMP